MSPTSPRLGKGLAALMGEAPSTRTSATGGARTLALTDLQPGPFQPRTSFNAGSLDELVSSIKAQGVLQPLLARPHPDKPGEFQIIAGERRWRAAQQAGLHDVPVLVRELSDVDAMAASLVENLQRQDLNPVEEGEGFRRLLDEFGLTQEQLATAIGKSRSYVANAMRLLNLPESVRKSLQDGKLSAGHARALLAHPDPETAARKVLDRGLTVRQTEALAAAGKTEPLAAREHSKDPETEALERDLCERLGLSVRLSFDGKGGSLMIRYGNLDQLDGIVALLSQRSAA